MIDIREHGGSFGGGKYRKGYKFSPEELGIKVVPIQTLVTYTSDLRVDGIAMDTDGVLWTCGYSTSSGTRYMYKSVWNGSWQYLSYTQTLSVGGLNASAYPSQLFILPGQPYVYMNDQYFKRYNKDTGTYLNTFVDSANSSNYFLHTLTASKDGNYIYAYCDATQKLFKLNPDLSIVASMVTAQKWNSEYAFVDNRYFLMHNYNSYDQATAPYKTLMYDMETMSGPYYKSGQNNNEGVTSGVNNPLFNISDGTHFYKIRGQYIARYRISDMNKEVYVRVLSGASETLSGMYNYDADHLAVFYQASGSSPRVLRLLKKSDLLTFVDLPYGFTLDSSVNVLQADTKNGVYIYGMSDGTWKAKRVKVDYIIQ
jgi:hypothetical protein